MTIFDRTGFNFDSSKFGEILNFTPEVEQYLSDSEDPLTDWQKEDISSDEVSGYYKNPLIDILQSLEPVSINIASIVSNTEIIFTSANVNALSSSAVTLSAEVPEFIIHTDLLSGVLEDVPFELEDRPDLAFDQQPSLRYAISIGQQVLTITNKSDGIQNNSPILGNFTSLFIRDDIVQYPDLLQIDLETLENSLNTSTTGSGTEEDPFVTIITSNVTQQQVDSILSHVQPVQNILTTRRAHDRNFYQNSYDIVNDFQKVQEFNLISTTQKNLIDQLIGTDKLKSRIG
jgi:hypothetical protein